MEAHSVQRLRGDTRKMPIKGPRGEVLPTTRQVTKPTEGIGSSSPKSQDYCRSILPG